MNADPITPEEIAEWTAACKTTNNMEMCDFTSLALDALPRLLERVRELEEELHGVADLVDDVLYDPTFHPINRTTGKEVRGNDLYLQDHPVQDQNMPALRAWFVEFHKKLSTKQETPDDP